MAPPKLTANVGKRTSKGTLVTEKIARASAGDYAGVLEIREDNTEAIQRSIVPSLMKALEKVGLVAEGYAKMLCPVDTGRLRNSITHQLKGLSVYIGTNVEYAPFVENGRRGKNGKHFLRRAATEHGEQYRKIIEDSMRNA